MGLTKVLPNLLVISYINPSALKLILPMARIFLLADLREFFSDLGSGGRNKKINKKL